MYREKRRQLTLWVIAALMTGILTGGSTITGKAVETMISGKRDMVENDHELINPTVNDKGDTIWDCIYFGNYWQEDTNGDGKADRRDAKMPIKWRVLSVDGDDVFLLADKNLGVRRYGAYNTDEGGADSIGMTDITWEISTVRSWLNGYGAEENIAGEDYRGKGFLNEAFSQVEQQAIRPAIVKSDENPSYGTKGGNDTCDKVYLLSCAEVMNPAYGFSAESTVAANKCRTAKNTDLGMMQGASTNKTIAYEGNGAWWLRTPGYGGNLVTYVTYVTTQGDVDLHGASVRSDVITIRPVLHLDLAAESGWAWAGKISSIGKVIEMADPPAVLQPSHSPVASQTPDVSPGEPSDGGADHGLKNPTIDSYGITTWDRVWFGKYWGEDDSNRDNKVDRKDDPSMLTWRVLSVRGDDAFLLADKVLDCQRYNSECRDVTWETSTLRSWLNGYGAGANVQGKDFRGQGFLNNAFTEEEQQAIRTTTVVNEDNYYFGVEGGADTEDKVYLLSLDEVTDPAYGFTAEDTYDERFSRGCRRARLAEYTPFLLSQEAWIGGFIQYTEDEGRRKYAQWWLRSPGAYRNCAIRVDAFGHIMMGSMASPGWEIAVNSPDVAVRPVLHLDLSAVSASNAAPLWYCAGTVNSGGEEKTVLPGVKSPGPTQTPQVKPVVTPDTNCQDEKKKEDKKKKQRVAAADRRPGKILRVKISQKNRTLTVVWKKVPQADGYQICYSTSPSWKRKKQKKILKNEVALKKLKQKKTYYVRVRAYYINGTNIVYGSWSNKRKIEIKKSKVVSGKKYITGKKSKRTAAAGGRKEGTVKTQAIVEKKKRSYTVMGKESAAGSPVVTETQMPTPVPQSDGTVLLDKTASPDDSKKDAGDAEALRNLIKYQKSYGARVSEDLDSEQYKWNDEGRLTAINWNWCGLAAGLDVSGYTALESLSCWGNSLRELFVENCDSLKFLDCHRNEIRELEVGGCPLLTVLNCRDTWLYELDITRNPLLKSLDCAGTRLSALNVDNSLSLRELNCTGSQLSSLVVGDCPNLRELICGRNNLSSLDVGGCPKLEKLECGDNDLSSLDVEDCLKLKEFVCSNNKLSSLDVGECLSLVRLECRWNELDRLDVSGSPRLEELDCKGNKLSSLDVGECLSLLHLECGWNELDRLDVSTCPGLRMLGCGKNSLDSLDVSVNSDLRTLECNENSLESLDVSANSELRTLDCNANSLESLDVGANPELRMLNCSANSLNFLDVSANPKLVRLLCGKNQIGSLDVSANPKLLYLSCERNKLSSLDVSANTELRGLICSEKVMIEGCSGEIIGRTLEGWG